MIAAVVAAMVGLSGCASQKQDDWCPTGGPEQPAKANPKQETRAASYWRQDKAR